MRGGVLYAILLALICHSIAVQAAPPDKTALEVLWRDEGSEDTLVWRTFDASGKPLQDTHSTDSARENLTGPFAARAPLGSLWKLFVYLWLVEERRPAPDYVCSSLPGASAQARKRSKDEVYCCDPGQAIDRDTALVRSCGRFFEPQRLKIDPLAWREFWQARPGVRSAAPWLAELGAMKPETVVSPASILSALTAAPARARQEAANILLARVFSTGSAASQPTELIRRTGGQLRIKTFSWHRPGQPKSLYGGAAGWLSDGRPIWFAGEGTGQQVMARHGATLAAALPEAQPSGAAALSPGCVTVNFFARYPFELEQAGGKPAVEGVLRGRHVARFQNGVSLPFTANGELYFARADGHARIEGRFGIDDYVARVLEREADAKETEAARALSVVIRSYLINEASKQGNCLTIDDSSRTQRVSINPPGATSRAIADFTRGLVLTGTPVGYHIDTPATNRMAWTQTVAAGKAGQPWDIILRKTFPKADLAAMHDPAGVGCQPFAEAENWLAARAPQWQRSLQQGLPGFEAPPAPRICLLPYGTPFSEQDRGRIHLRGLRTSEDRITLAHEYLHLGLAHHPSGHDEVLIERWARKLTGETNAVE
jgi:uncharacterized protein YfaQ (DUF2300 family)